MPCQKPFTWTSALPALLALGLAACTPDLAPPPPVPAIPPSGELPPLAWEAGHPERAAWSAHLRAMVGKDLARFGAPADIDAYCPPFAGLSPEARIEVLSTLAVAMARRESGYKPDTVFKEPPPLNVDSVGLFQLSYEDGFGWCALDRATASLQDPLNNITCAVGEMARLVARDGVIAAGSKASDAKGLSRYWSVVRDGTGHFKAEIQGKTRALPQCQ